MTKPSSTFLTTITETATLLRKLSERKPCDLLLKGNQDQKEEKGAAKIKVLIEHSNEKEYVNEAPDPKFIQKEEFDKYLNLPDEAKFVQTYTRQIVNYFSNLDDKDYDYVNDEDDRIIVRLTKKNTKEKGKSDKIK